MADVELGNLYDINKELMKKEKPIEAILLQQKLLEPAELIAATDYTLLLNKERADYTIFKGGFFGKKQCALSNLRECLTNRGKVLSIDKLPDGNFEIWISIEDEEGNEEPYVYYLFNYSFGIVDCCGEAIGDE